MPIGSPVIEFTKIRPICARLVLLGRVLVHAVSCQIEGCLASKEASLSVRISNTKNLLFDLFQKKEARMCGGQLSIMESSGRGTDCRGGAALSVCRLVSGEQIVVGAPRVWRALPGQQIV